MNAVREKLEMKALSIPSDQHGIVAYTKDTERQNPETSGMIYSLEQAKERIAMLQSFIRDMMVENVDYGIIPGTDKRCLFKSGAEKLCDIFGFSKRIDIVSRIENFEKGIFHYEVKAILISKRNGEVEAEGVGSCNNMERKFRNQDACSVANTVLKMAKKRAFVDAVLSATRSSDLFTQDVEDNDELALKGTKKGKEASKAAAAGKTIAETKTETIMASRKQISFIFTILSQKNIPVDLARNLMEEKYKIRETKALTQNQASEFIEYLKDYKAV
jgi:hypothetical protein